MISRRTFIRQVALATGGVLAAGTLASLTPSREKRLVILHTNDTHSRIDPFPPNDPRYANLGGASRRKTLIDKIRKEEENVLLLDAGDIFQGTPYFNLFGGEVELKLMSEMNYDAATIGNHDFDNGIDGLASVSRFATFPFISSNYDFSNTPMAEIAKPYQVFVKDGIRVGVFGLGVELQGLVDPALYKETRYLDPLATTEKMVSRLKEEKCNLIICLSHLGYSYKGDKVSDEIIARQTAGIDLIIGGHTHTFLHEPVKFRNKEGKEVLVAQQGWAGINLGKITYTFNRKGEKKIVSGTSYRIDENLLKT